MDRQDALQEIRISWRRLYPADKKGRGIVCPLCGSGSGTHGTGITADAGHGKPESLRCWNCGFSGDVIDLMQKETGASFNEALQNAADQLGIIIDRSEPHNRQERPTERRPQTAEPAEPEPLADYTEYYQTCEARLQADPEAIFYLQARGISARTIEKWHIGYDPAWISPTTEKRLAAEGNEWRPAPTKRIIVPVNSNHYIARAIDPEVKEYAKMNETGGGKIGIFNEKAAKGAGPVFITEGVFDALAIEEAGEEAIALNSTSNAEKLLQDLEGIQEPAPLILSLDNDAAGRKTAGTIKDAMEKNGWIYALANVSGIYKDPNESLINEREAFAERVTDAAAEIMEKVIQERKSVIARFLDTVQSEAYRPYETGVPFFDRLLGGGVIRQTLLFLLGAPGTGKTTLCQQIAEGMAAHGKPVIYLNFEMSREQMIAKAISGRTCRKPSGGKYSMLDILQGYKWTPEQREEILSEAAAYEKEILQYLQYNPAGISSNLEALQDYLRQLGDAAKAEKREAPAIIVDYLHLIGSAQRIETQELIKHAVRALKDYAITYNTFVIAISATNRASNQRGQQTEDSGRDSSAIEYTADYLLSLNYYEVEQRQVDPADAAEMGKLKRAPWRKVVLRLNKSRFTTAGRDENLYFYTAGNTFYGPGEWMPADAERVPFLQDQKTDQRKRY